MARTAIATIALVLIQLTMDAGVESGAAQCRADCDIELQRIVTLADPGPAADLPIQSMFVTAAGPNRYLIASDDSTKLLVFDRAGRISQVADGGSQHRFTLITNILPAPGRPLLVYDTAQRSLFTLSDEFVISKAVTFQYRPTIALSKGLFVHAGQIVLKDLVGQPMHLLNDLGAVVRSFGSEDGTYRADEPLRYDRKIATSTDGTIWSAAPGRYVLERWHPLTGVRQTRLVIASSWFRESVRFTPSSERPAPIIVSLWESGEFLWILLRDADANWRPIPATPGERMFDADVHDRRFDWVLEVVSTKTGAIVATRRFDLGLYGREPSFLLASRQPKMRQGFVSIDVWKPQLVPRKERTHDR